MVCPLLVDNVLGDRGTGRGEGLERDVIQVYQLCGRRGECGMDRAVGCLVGDMVFVMLDGLPYWSEG